MSKIVGACVSQYHGEENEFELLLAFADGREIGHSVSRKVAQDLASELIESTGNAALSSRSAEAGKPVVKALEWKESHETWFDKDSNDRKASASFWAAHPPHLIFSYDIMLFADERFPKVSREYELTIGSKKTPFPTLEAAKAAAQADYERRILSALAAPVADIEPVSVPDTVTKAALKSIIATVNDKTLSLKSVRTRVWAFAKNALDGGAA